MARVRYTPEIGKYLRENYKNKTLAELATHFGCGMSSIRRWLFMLKINKNEHGGPGRPKKNHGKIISPGTSEPKVMPETDRRLYSNISREEHIERILNMAV
jgi:hypothetical protein